MMSIISMSCLNISCVLSAFIVMISAYPVMDPVHGTGLDSIDPAPHPGSGPQPPEPLPPEPPHPIKYPSPPGLGPIGPVNPVGPIDTWLPGPRGPIDHGSPIIPLPPIVPVFPWKPMIPGTISRPLYPREQSDS